MRCQVKKNHAVMLLLFSILGTSTAISSNPSHTVIQLGGFWAEQGKAQVINIQGLSGNQYTVHNNNPSNGLIGLGYFIDGLEQERAQLAYGLNLFYLGPTNVQGYIFEEQRYNNLAYTYKIRHMPLYLEAKAKIKTPKEAYNVTFDAGIGPNFMRAGSYQETALNAFTLPDNAFISQTKVNFTATAGAGIRINQVLGNAPIELGYRFFYLGEGQLSINNNQLMNTLKTGHIFSNAIVCSIIV